MLQILARVLDRAHQVQIVRKDGRVGQEYVQAAFSSLNAKRRTDELRGVDPLHAQWQAANRAWVNLEEIHTARRLRWELDPIREWRSCQTRT